MTHQCVPLELVGLEDRREIAYRKETNSRVLINWFGFVTVMRVLKHFFFGITNLSAATALADFEVNARHVHSH